MYLNNDELSKEAYDYYIDNNLGPIETVEIDGETKVNAGNNV